MDNPDIRQLKVLSVLHYVFAGYYIVIGLVVFRFVTGVLIGSAEILADPARDPDPSESLDSWGQIILVSAIYILWWVWALCLVLMGRKLQRGKSRIFCLIIAGTECLSFPLGTLLGAFTLVCLTRDSVKEFFAGRNADPIGI